MMELLAPAGSFDAVVAAVQSGADAVYIGGKAFSARSGAENFDNEEILKVIRYCHLRGVKVHVAANILVKEKEVKNFLDYMGFLNAVGVDAVIIQDIGMAKAVREKYPDLPLHASTQMTAASLSAVNYLAKMGFTRAVLARELSAEEIGYISKNATIETECFIHGAICMCYSGQCLMSSIIGARSGNRGMCAQPCRLPYEFSQGKRGYLLSPKDMSLIDELKKLDIINVTSLKIEGRLKRPEYVATVVGIYRKYLDTPSSVSEEDKEILLKSFSRSGFTDGYFKNELGKEMMSYETPGNTSENTFYKEFTDCMNSENRKSGVNIYCIMKKGEPFTVTIIDMRGRTAIAKSTEVVEKAANKPISEERLREQLVKLGDTVFEAVNIELEVDSDAFIPIKVINETRRQVVKMLEDEMLKMIARRVNNGGFAENINSEAERILTASVCTKEQLAACEEVGVKVVYLPRELIYFAKKDDVKYVVKLPQICDDDTKWDIPEKFGVLISNIGQEEIYREYRKYGNFRLNITNSHSARVFKNYETLTVSAELNLKDIERISATAKEAIVYGKLPLMIMKNCPVKAITDRCGKGKEYSLTDRRGEEFTFTCDETCHSIILNSKNIYMADKLHDLNKVGITRFRLDFFDENYNETKKIITEYQMALEGERLPQPKENTFTRGHFYRGI